MAKCWIAVSVVALFPCLVQTTNTTTPKPSTQPVPTLTNPPAQILPLRPVNITLKPSSQSLHVQWSPPTQNLSLIDSYRVRIFQTFRVERKVVHWVPGEDGSSLTISCLQPNTHYKVQILTRFRPSTKPPDDWDQSSVENVSTLPEPGFLSQVWAQRVYVMIGAIIMALVVLFFTPCICCCFARKRRNHRLDKGAMDRKTMKDSQSTEMADRRRPSDPEDRYSDDPLQSLSYRLRSTFGLSTNQHSRMATQPNSPPSYLQVNPHTSHSERRPVPLPPDEEDESDHDDYQNDVFLPGPAEDIYVNQSFSPTSPLPEASIYGNIQY